MRLGDFAATVSAVDWPVNVASFIATPSNVHTVERGCRLISVWNQELSFQYNENPALPFLQEMKASLFHGPTCLSLGLYKPAASCMRTALENALYFTYFVDHQVELTTLVTRESFYISKSDIMDYHNLHTNGFRDRQKELGFTSELNAWYSSISAIVHGQIPGVWSAHSLAETGYSQTTNNSAIKYFQRVVTLINYLFLITTSDEIWDGFSSNARQTFLKGISMKKKVVLNRALV